MAEKYTDRVNDAKVSVGANEALISFTWSYEDGKISYEDIECDDLDFVFNNAAHIRSILDVFVKREINVKTQPKNEE